VENQRKNIGQTKRDDIAKDLKKVMTKRVKLALEYKVRRPLFLMYRTSTMDSSEISSSCRISFSKPNNSKTLLSNFTFKHFKLILIIERWKRLFVNEMKNWPTSNKSSKTVSSSPHCLTFIIQSILIAPSFFAQTVKKILKTYREDGKRLLADAEESIEEANEDISARIVARRKEGQDKLEELEAERDELNASLECMINISPAVLEAYKKRKGEVSFSSFFIVLAASYSLWLDSRSRNSLRISKKLQTNSTSRRLSSLTPR